MKKIIKNLKKQAKKLESIVDKRRTYYDKKSEKWQNSIKGNEHINITNIMIDKLYELKFLIIDLKDLL